MSSPTININESTSYTSLLTICNLIRAIINDSQQGLTAEPGEGQIWTDTSSVSPFVQPLLNSAIRSLYRQLRLVGDPVLLFDNYLVTGLPIINSPSYGLGQPDPAVQTVLSQTGYFDGVQQWANFTLPSNIIAPERLWERETNTTNLFRPMHQPQFGLPSVLQGPVLGLWEWRNQNINFVGSTASRDIRIRYYGNLPQFFSQTLDFAATFVPVVDCTDAVAYMAAAKYAQMLGSPNYKDIQATAIEEMFRLKQSHVRRSQSMDYHRIPFGSHGDHGGGDGWGGGFNSGY